MEEKYHFPMSEHLENIKNRLEELKNEIEAIITTFQQTIDTTLMITNSSQDINLLLNNMDYRNTIREPLLEFKELNTTDQDRISQNISILMQVLETCKAAIIKAKNDGVEII